MRRSLHVVLSFVTLCALVVTAYGAETSLEGQWLLRSEGGNSSELTLSYREASSTGHWHEKTVRSVAGESLSGLDRASFQSRTGSTVAFEIRREAGTFRCEGWSRGGLASGHFTFRPDDGFARELARVGFGAPSARESLSLAIADTGMELVREIEGAGYDGVSVTQLVRASHHGVQAGYIRSLRDLGFQPASLDAVVRMQDHGVTVDFVREVLALGIAGLDDNGITRLRDHGVTPEFIRSMKAAGFDGLDARQLVRLRDHGVTPEYALAMRDAGLSRITADELVRLRDHGVGPDDVRALKAD